MNPSMHQKWQAIILYPITALFHEMTSLYIFVYFENTVLHILLGL
jgi:hypothetical protein